jgi:hypothetical protein
MDNVLDRRSDITVLLYYRPALRFGKQVTDIVDTIATLPTSTQNEIPFLYHVSIRPQEL